MPSSSPELELDQSRSVPALLRGMRPRQWLKNGLVFAAPAAAGALDHAGDLARLIIVFVAMCAVSSALYLANDVRDADADRAHPVKRYRPVASGALPAQLAVAVASVLMVSGLAAIAMVRLAALGLVLLYVATALSYTLGLKRVPVVELFAVAAGFVLRAGVGAATIDVPVSSWFLTVTSFAALAVVVGKRLCERRRADPDDPGRTREVLSAYPEAFLGQVLTVAMGGTLVAYALWAFERAEVLGDDAWFLQLSCVPFAIATMRYLLLVQSGKAEAPEDALFADRVIVVLGAIWAVCFALGVRSL